MSLLDNLVNSALNNVGSQQTGFASIEQVLKVAGTFLQNNGGIQSLVTQFNQAGIGHIIQSWIGTGQNAAISGSQLSQIFGSGQLNQIAQQLGVDSSQASHLLAQYLPQLIDQLTPNGQMPVGNAIPGDMLSSALGMLKGKLLG